MIKSNEKGILLELRVSPGKNQFSFQGFDKWANALKVNTASQPENGKANKELIKELEKFFNAKAEILKGKTSRKKTVLVKTSSENAKKQLEKL